MANFLKFISFIFIVSCVHSNLDELEIIKTKYKQGDCVYLVDPENNYRGNKKDIMKIVDITTTLYVYKWYIYLTNNWAIDSNMKTHYNFEKITERLEVCPF